MKRQLGYLSGAPRVSTKPNAELAGPRSHVLGVIHAFEALGWEVSPFIVGDQVPEQWITTGSGEQLSKSLFRAAAADLVRIGSNIINSHRAWRTVGHQTDWVYERFSALQMLGWQFKKQGIPWLLETNAPLFYEAKIERRSIALTPLVKKREIWAYRNCDVLICVSDALKEIIVQEINIPPDKILVMPNGVDTTFFNPTLHSTKRFFREFTIGFVGLIMPWAGLDYLLFVLADLKSEGIELRLVIVGDGPEKTNLQQLVTELGLTETVHFTGRISPDEVPAYIAGFDVCYSGQVPLQIGKMYLSPMKLYEYMAMGKTVIASAFDDARQLIQEEKNGFLFEPANRQSLKHALKKVYLAKSILVDMGAAARTSVEVDHGWEARVRILIEGVEAILGMVQK
jgi:glycosyltransferase involved in cell wall biosynthesis